MWKIVVPPLAFAAALCAVEGAALLANRGAGDARPFLWDPGPARGPAEGRRLSFVDPLLGAAWNPAALGDSARSYRHGFFVTGDPGDPAALRIVTLGGSTTEHSEGCWPTALQGMLAEAGIPAVVFNGGRSGMKSPGQVVKLFRDGLLLRPDVVISYDGVNDADIAGEGERPWQYEETQEALMALASGSRGTRPMPNATALARRWLGGGGIEGVEWGMPSDLSSARTWARSVRAMKALAEASGARYLDVLQPAFGVGPRRPSDDEARRVVAGGACRMGFEGFYPEARALAAGSGGTTVDLTGVFDDAPDVYRDHCHVTAEGNRMVARAIRDALRARGWLDRPAAPGGT